MLPTPLPSRLAEAQSVGDGIRPRKDVVQGTLALRHLNVRPRRCRRRERKHPMGEPRQTRAEKAETLAKPPTPTHCRALCRGPRTSAALV